MKGALPKRGSEGSEGIDSTDTSHNYSTKTDHRRLVPSGSRGILLYTAYTSNSYCAEREELLARGVWTATPFPPALDTAAAQVQ